MPKIASAAVRRTLVERAAQMLARREPVTLRALVADTGVSTMAVYTHFDGMPGLWRAVRQEGFGLLAEELSAVKPTSDPVRDMVAYGAAYLSNALAHPDLYRVMFDAGFDLEDPEVANELFAVLISCAARATEVGRFRSDTNPQALAIRFWAFGHGLGMLVLTGVLPASAIDEHVRPMLTAIFLAAGDDAARCSRSVRAGWRTFRHAAASDG